MSDSLWPYGLEPTRLHGILQARILEWVAIPFSLGSSQSRDWTQVSCIAGRFFMVWTTCKYSNSCLVWLIIIQNTDIHVYTTTFHTSSDISKNTEKKLTCTVRQSSRPRSIGCALPNWRSRKNISLHAGINDWTRKCCAINPKDFSIGCCPRVTTLYS